MKTKDICKDRSLCSGCEACANGCAQNAIEMKSDWRGFLYPSINQSKCVDCGLCAKICPVNIEERTPFVFDKASVYVDKNQITFNRASSGGAFGVMARYVISNGGVVYGCSMDDDYNVKFIAAETEEELEQLHGSKYVQSKVGFVYREIREVLKSGQLALLGACPCQIAGLKSFLRKDYDNLITMDLICHGVPSQPYFKDYVHDLLKKKQGVSSFLFRNKKETEYDIGKNRITKDKVYVGYYNKDYYMTPFLWGKGYRSSCYKCLYAGGERQGDFTIGDFWNNSNAHFQIDDSHGVSLVLFNTSKAKALEVVFKQNSDYVDCPSLDLAMGTKSHGQLAHPSKNDIRTDLAYLLYKIFGLSGPKVLFALQCKLMNLKK